MSDTKNPVWSMPDLDKKRENELREMAQRDSEDVQKELDELLRFTGPVIQKDDEPSKPMPPLDINAERQAFKELMQFFADNPEEHTTVTLLDETEFGTPMPSTPSTPKGDKS